MRANPGLNYTAALRQVQAGREPRSAAPPDRPHEGQSGVLVVIDPLHDLATPKTIALDEAVKVPTEPLQAARDCVDRALHGPALPELPTEYVREQLREHSANAETPVVSDAPGSFNPFHLSGGDTDAEENTQSPTADDPNLHAVETVDLRVEDEDAVAAMLRTRSPRLPSRVRFMYRTGPGRTSRG